MAGKLVLRGTSVGTITLSYYFDGNLIAKVKAGEDLPVDIQTSGILTAKGLMGFKCAGKLLIKDNIATYIRVCEDKTWGNRIEIEKEISIEEMNRIEMANNSKQEDEPKYVLDGGMKDILYVYEECIVISHSGFLNALSMGIKGNKTIYYSDISSVQFKKSGMSAGYIQFSLPGGNENRGGVFSAMSDENSIAIKAGYININKQAEEVIEFINQKIREIKSGAKVATTVVQQTSSADELKKFKELLDSGIITQEEFDAKKKQLLGL